MHRQWVYQNHYPAPVLLGETMEIATVIGLGIMLILIEIWYESNR